MKVMGMNRVAPMWQRMCLSGLLAGVAAFGVSACQKSADSGATSAANATAASTSGSATDNANWPQIRIATESSYAPFSYKDAQGNVVGFEIDLAHELCEQAKIRCEIISQDWDGLIPGLQAQKYSAIMASMSDTPKRREVVTFSEPYFINNLLILGKKGVDKGADDLAGKTIAVERATTAADYIAAHFPNAVVKSYDNQENAYLDLASGRADLMLSDSAPALHWLNTDRGQGFEVKGEPIKIDDKIAIAMRQNDPLVGQFNDALAALKANGKYDKLYHQYFADIHQ